MTRALPRLGRLATALMALAAATGIVATTAPAHADTGNSCDKYRFLGSKWYITHGSYNGADVWSFRSYIHPGIAGQAVSNAYGATVASEPVSNNLNQWMEIM
jgi:hypothetical protein